MKFLWVVPVVLYLAGCAFSLAPAQNGRGADQDASLDNEPISDSALSEMGLESVLAPPGILSPAGTAEAPESLIFSNNTQTVNPLPPTTIPVTNLNGGPAQGSTPSATAGFSPTIPNFSIRPTVPGQGSVLGPGSGAGAGAGPAF